MLYTRMAPFEKWYCVSCRSRPQASARLKYRLYYGSADGRSMVRYDNESGKGDHCHVGDREEGYRFRSVEVLVADFLRDIDQARGDQTP